MSNNHPNRTKAAARRREAREGGDASAAPLGSAAPMGGPSAFPTPRRAMPGVSIRRAGEAADDLAEAVRGLSAAEVEQLRSAGLDPVRIGHLAGDFADAVLRE